MPVRDLRLAGLMRMLFWAVTDERAGGVMGRERSELLLCECELHKPQFGWGSRDLESEATTPPTPEAQAFSSPRDNFTKGPDTSSEPGASPLFLPGVSQVRARPMESKVERIESGESMNSQPVPMDAIS